MDRLVCIVWYGIIIDVNKIIFIYIYMSEQKVHQLTSSQKRALADGKTTRHFSRGLHAPAPTLRQRAMYPDERGESGDALYIAREKGLLDNIKQFGDKRKAAKPIIKSIGRRNVNRFPIKRLKKGNVEIPTFLTRKIKSYDRGEISDLTKTGFGAESQRKPQGRGRGRRKTPQSAGKRKTKRRKKRTRRRKKKTKKRRKKRRRSRRR